MSLPRGDPGALITAIKNPGNHAASRPTEARALVDAGRSPSLVQGSMITAITNPSNPAASHPKGTRAREVRQTDGKW